MELPCIAPPLLAWYEQNKRILPFRTLSTPYRVWVSEIMLQQTRVSAAVPYFERFMQALPTVKDLAECDPDRLVKLWEGLGYYSRVRNLQKAAQIIMQQYGGELPADYDALLKLPGIGAYTAGAIASISFGLPVPAVDGNVLRVFSRIFNDSRDITEPAVKKEMTSRVMSMQPADRPGDYNQALMELGALVCVPNGTPLCENCPLHDLCRARKCGTAEKLPVKPPAVPKKILHYTVLPVLSPDRTRVLLNRRPETGLLAGLWQPVSAEGTLSAEEAAEFLYRRGIRASVLQSLPEARHVFTHLIWEMTGFLCAAESDALPEGCVWAGRAELESTYALPNAYRAYRIALKKFL